MHDCPDVGPKANWGLSMTDYEVVLTAFVTVKNPRVSPSERFFASGAMAMTDFEPTSIKAAYEKAEQFLCECFNKQVDETFQPEPVLFTSMILICPKCNHKKVDQEIKYKMFHTCPKCQYQWRPATIPTRGVETIDQT